VFIAGGIGRGEAMASYLEMGASGVQLGTRFVCASESIAHAKFKECFIRSQSRDAQPSVQIDPDFPVIPVRAIVNKATDAFTRKQHEVIAEFRSGKLDKKEAQLAIEHFWAGALRKAVIDGDVENGSVMAGQSVGMVSKIQPVAEILDELITQAEDYLTSRKLKTCHA
jgi:enoyl-[acyl-carrier protein] reductase II